MSAQFSKMRLVPEGEYERLRAKGIREYDPSVKQVLRDIETADSIVNPKTSTTSAATSSSSTKKRRGTKRLPLLSAFSTSNSGTKTPARRPRKHGRGQQPSLGEQVLRYQHAMERVRKRIKPPEMANSAAAAPRSTQSSEGVREPGGGGASNAAAPAAARAPSSLDAITLHALDMTLNSLAKQYRQRATQLVDWITQHATLEDISINQNHELVLNGKLIDDSSVIDIFKKIFVKSKHPFPIGYHDFIHLLIKIHTPHAFLGYARIPAQVGQGIAINSNFNPPGQLPIILRVYPNV